MHKKEREVSFIEITSGLTNMQLNINEAILWDQFRSGSIKAFNTIYYRYIKTLYNYGHKFTSDSELIEDCIQDLFIEIWQKKDILSATSSIKYYLFKAVKLKIIRKLKKDRTITERLSFSDEYNFEVVFSHEFSLIAQQITEEEKNNLSKALESLTPRQKEAIFLRYYEKLSFEEVSSLLTINIKATYKLIARAIEVLRSNMVKNIIILTTWFNL